MLHGCGKIEAAGLMCFIVMTTIPELSFWNREGPNPTGRVVLSPERPVVWTSLASLGGLESQGFP
jgi:hypothetical protein